MTKLTPCILMLDEGIAQIKESIPELPACEAAIARLIRLVGARVEEELARKLKPHKLNDSEFRTLMILFSRPDGTSTPGELCDFTSQGATNMTRIADALTKRGLMSCCDTTAIVTRFNCRSMRLSSREDNVER